VERDYVRDYWLMGAAHRAAGHHDEAERHLHQALERCRRINMVDHEADILIDLSRLRSATGSPEEAHRLAEEALLITERSGYVLQGADAHLELAKLALARGDKTGTSQHATEARRLATCDGPPDYTYKVALYEADKLYNQTRAFRLTEIEGRHSIRERPLATASRRDTKHAQSALSVESSMPRIFVSHSTEDKNFVFTLMKDLEKRNLKVWIDHRELKPGDSIIQGIEGGLGNTDYVVIVLSEASVESAWVKAEMSSALMHQLSGGGTTVLPVVIDDCTIPPLLRALVYADFRGDYETGLTQLLRAIDRKSGSAG
jgi:hypothetical protein